MTVRERIGVDLGGRRRLEDGLAWAAAAFTPERVDHLAALSVGHPRSFGDAGYEQL